MSSTITQLSTPLLTGRTVEEKRQELKLYFENSWNTYEALFSLINNEQAFYARPEPLRHPLIFYYGHTATFYINKLILGKYISTRVDEKLEAICAVGVDEMSWDDLDSNHYDWPSVEEVRRYRDKVFQLVSQLIDDMPLELPITQDSLAWVILMGCEHERIHLETSSVIMRMLPLEDLTPNNRWYSCPHSGDAPENSLIEFPATQVTLGKKQTDVTYGWDNEYGQEHFSVEAFKASKYLVSNGEFLAFVESGGYQTPEFWTEEGQSWLEYKKAEMPRFWKKEQGKYLQRNLLEEVALPLNWPVEVNYLEAKAFCFWKSQQTNSFIRLPTEPEWYSLRRQLPKDAYQWQETPGNVNLSYYASSCPVNRFKQGELFDICGNVWQWTESPIDAFTGFSVHPLYDDFSTPTFDGKHNLIKGGSWISTGNEAIISSRYAFRRHFFQHAGFRYIQTHTDDLPHINVNKFESDASVCRELFSHYGVSNYDNYPLKLANSVKQVLAQFNMSHCKLLHMGCSVGRTSFALSEAVEQIDALDFTARYIHFGVQLQQQASVRFEMVNQGDIVNFHEISLNNLAIPFKSNLNFYQGDAVNLKPVFDQYDAVLIDQALERSYDPKQALKTLCSRVRTGGLIIIASSYIYDESICEKSKWLSGLKVNGENQEGVAGLISLLSPRFELLQTEELMRVNPLNSRQFLNERIELTIWRCLQDS